VGPEGNSGLTDFVFTVTLSPASTSTVKVKWTTETCTATPKDCLPGSPDADYQNDDGVLVFSPGQTTKTITVKVYGDHVPEGQEVFLVALHAPQNAVIASLPQGQGQGIIDDDDGGPGSGLAPDFNGDGKTDILWRHQVSNRVVGWTMRGLNKLGGDYVTSGGTPITLDPAAAVAGVGDLDGDGDGDLLVQTSTGTLEYHYLDGLVQVDVQSRSGQADPGWRAVGTADFNGDDHLDLLWRHEVTGHLNVWYMNDRTLLGTANLSPLFVPTLLDPSLPDLAWKVAGIGDFDADGHPDLLFRHDGSRRLVIWQLDGVVRVAGGFVNPDRPADFESWEVGGVWDVDQDGTADIVFRNVTSGANVVWYMDGRARVCGTYFNPPTLPDLNWVQVGPR
jgi:hypothetical protein